MEMRVEQSKWTAERGWDPVLGSFILGDAAQLVLLFGSVKCVRTHDCMNQIRKAFPQAHVVGCTSGGEILGAEVCDETLALTAVAFADTRVAVAQTSIAGIDQSAEAGERLIRQLDPVGLRHVLVLSEGLQVNSSELVGGIAGALPPGATASGGMAADGNLLKETFVWCDGEPEQAKVAAVGFYGERLRTGVSITGGWRPFGPDRVITKARKNVLYEFDGRPALSLYKQYLGEHAAGLPAAGLNFPIELCVGSCPERVLRALLAVDEQEQSITFAGNVPEGSLARFMMGQIEDLISGAHKAAKVSLENLGVPQPKLAVLVSCNARRIVLRQRVDEEIEVVREVLGEQTALTGFYSYGEIAALGKDPLPQLHNESMMILSIAED